MDEIDLAFTNVPRRHFVLPSMTASASADMPLPIGFGQTISQPTTVRFMLDRLDVQPGDRILDVGSGSGWTTALLAYLTGSAGKVFAVEIIPELVSFGRNNCLSLGIKNAYFYRASKQYGMPGLGPYDRILVSAEAPDLPQELIDQLKVGGKMVIPVGRSILEVEKMNVNELDIHEHFGFVFVPLVR